MTIAKRWAFLGCVSLFLLTGCQNPTEPAAQTANARMANAQAANDASAVPAPTGRFDYYLLTLSWAPEFCHGHANSPECDGRHNGFVVHGLWPQFQDGRWPSHCSNTPEASDSSSMLDIMPDPRLIAHEWATHGTCTGLTAAQYFRVVRKAYQTVKIPSALQSPSQASRQSAADIKQMFTDANPLLSANGIAISCHNRYLAGVEFCMSKTLQPIACQAVRDCDARSITIPAAR